MAHSPVSTCLQMTDSIEELAVDFEGDVFDVMSVYLTVQCLQCSKMFCTAPFLRHVIGTFLLILVNTAHLKKMGHYYCKRWFLSPPASVVVFLWPWLNPSSVEWRSGDALRSVWYQCQTVVKKNKSWNLFMLSLSIVQPACLGQLSLPMNDADAL